VAEGRMPSKSCVRATVRGVESLPLRKNLKKNPMQAKLDHVVLWVADPLRSLEFYEQVVGLAPVRADEFREG
jgi:hypothetical protein